MMEQKKINRISELTKISRVRPLTNEEQQERHRLRQEYIDAFRSSLISNLENTYIVDEKGNKTKLQKKKNNNI